jgi:predicted TIM-barrel fold metal-dependent hydrolase
MAALIDADQHLFERRELWAEYAASSERDLCLRIADDEQGFGWVTWHGERIYPAEVFQPGDVDGTGEGRQRNRAGSRAAVNYDDAPRHYWDPDARVAHLDLLGVDEAVLFPNAGLVWERVVGRDRRALEVNMAAWNRWAVDVADQGRGRLHPVAHVSLRNIAWLEEQLGALSRGGVRLAMLAPAPVDGKALHDPALDRAWSLFVEHGVTPVFHVSNFDRPFDDAWYGADFDTVDPVLQTSFIWVAPALALADLAIHGVLARHPELRLGVMELSAAWTAHFLPSLDGSFDFHRRQNGRPLTELSERPSDYIRRQVRIAAFAYERPDLLRERTGELFMMCSDYPHGEGTATPLEDYRTQCTRGGVPEESPGLFGGNISWLLRRDL